MLIVLSGLPGTGKTTISQQLARLCHATYLRIDTIEQAILPTLPNPNDLGALGYIVAYALADANLRLGSTVIADAVNPLTVIREAWQSVARQAQVDILEVEVVCSDLQEHQRRVESRVADIAGHTLPTWQEVWAREYQPWTSNPLVVDTAHLSAQQAALQIYEALQNPRRVAA